MVFIQHGTKKYIIGPYRYSLAESTALTITHPALQTTGGYKMTFSFIPLSRCLLLAATCGLWSGTAHAESPSFDCSKVADGSIEKMICNDKGLARLDRQLTGVYSAATEKAANKHPPVLKAEKRGWIKGRNDCWNSN